MAHLEKKQQETKSNCAGLVPFSIRFRSFHTLPLSKEGVGRDFMIVIPSVKTGIYDFFMGSGFPPAGRQVLTHARRSAPASRHRSDSPKYFLNLRVKFLGWLGMIKHGRGHDESY